MKFFQRTELCDRSKRKHRPEALVARGGMESGKPAAGESRCGEFFGIGEFLFDGESDCCRAIVEEFTERVGAPCVVFGPCLHRSRRGEFVFMGREGKRKDSDHLPAQKLNGLIEGIERERIGSGKGEVEKGGEGAVVERGTGVIEVDAGCDAQFHAFAHQRRLRLRERRGMPPSSAEESSSVPSCEEKEASVQRV